MKKYPIAALSNSENILPINPNTESLQLFIFNSS